jgi:hypothetical protein
MQPAERWVLAMIAALGLTAAEWIGYEKWQPSLYPKRFSEIWWHFPLWAVVLFVAISLDDRRRNRRN